MWSRGVPKMILLAGCGTAGAECPGKDPSARHYFRRIRTEPCGIGGWAVA